MTKIFFNETATLEMYFVDTRYFTSDMKTNAIVLFNGRSDTLKSVQRAFLLSSLSKKKINNFSSSIFNAFSSDCLLDFVLSIFF